MALKTHGLIIDEENNKMGKSNDESVDPEDLIYGSKKLNGERMFGYGVDTLRLWAASNDGDVNSRLSTSELDECNDYIKTFRQMLRLMLGNLTDFDAEQNTVLFDNLSPVDKFTVL